MSSPLNRDEIFNDVFDCETGSYGYAQLLRMYDGVGLLSDDELSEICQDLEMNDVQEHHDLITVGFLVGVARALEDQDNDDNGAG